MTLQVDIGLRRGDFSLEACFQAPTGGVTILFGPSGAGKSSLIDAVAGLIRPTSGRILLDGEALFEARRRIVVPPHRRRIGYVFQDHRLFPHFSVRGNLLYGVRFGAAREKSGALDEIVDLLGLDGLLARQPGSLSGGERQRVAIGRALLSRPRLLLLDEPMGALDHARKAELMPYFERLRDRLSIPILHVTHDLTELVRLGARLVLVDHGRVVAAGGVADLLARLDLPQLGPYDQMGALVDTVVESHDRATGLTRLRFAGGHLIVPQLDLDAGRSVRLMIKARDVALATTRPSDISMLNILSGRVVERGAEDGSMVTVRLDVGQPDTRKPDTSLALLARITRFSADQLNIVPGRSVFALIKAATIAATNLPGD